MAWAVTAEWVCERGGPEPEASVRLQSQSAQVLRLFLAQKRGWRTCPSKSIPADELERFVVDQIRTISRDPEITLRRTSWTPERLRPRQVVVQQMIEDSGDYVVR